MSSKRGRQTHADLAQYEKLSREHETLKKEIGAIRAKLDIPYQEYERVLQENSALRSSVEHLQRVVETMKQTMVLRTPDDSDDDDNPVVYVGSLFHNRAHEGKE